MLHSVTVTRDAAVAELDEQSGRIYLWTTAEHVYRDRIRMLPGARWDDKRRQWWMPISWAACVQIRAQMGPELGIGERLAEWAQYELEARVRPCMLLRSALKVDDFNSPEQEILMSWRK